MEWLSSPIGHYVAWIVGLGVLAYVLCQIMVLMLWRKVGPNEVLIISGRQHKVLDPTTGERKQIGYRVVHGGGSIVMPIFERADIMSLELITLDEGSMEFRTKQGVPISVDGVAQIKVKGDDISIRTAAEQFLSKNLVDIKNIAHQTVAGHLRAILSTMSVEEIYAQHEAFAQKVQEVAAQDLQHMGLTVVSFTIRQISDEQGYLDSLGKPMIAAVKRDATIAEAEAQRDSAIKSAQARQEAEAARFIAETKIAESERDFQVKQQEYAQSVNLEKANADLAYDLQRFKTAQQVKEEEIQVNIVEKQKQVELQQQEIQRKQLELEATVAKPADAERNRIQTLASAEQFRLKTTAEGQADATKLAGAAEAEANKVRGLAQADIVKAQGMAEGEMIRAKGLGEADAIKAKGLAEAEAMEKQAAAFKQYNEAAVASMFIDKLPEIASAVASPLAKVDKIVLVGNGSDGVGASRITAEVTNIVAQVPPVIEAMTGIKLGDLMSRVPRLTEVPPQPEATLPRPQQTQQPQRPPLPPSKPTPPPPPPPPPANTEAKNE